MQMIDVLKRLAELDAGNSNVVYANKQNMAEELTGAMPDKDTLALKIYDLGYDLYKYPGELPPGTQEEYNNALAMWNQHYKNLGDPHKIGSELSQAQLSARLARNKKPAEPTSMFQKAKTGVQNWLNKEDVSNDDTPDHPDAEKVLKHIKPEHHHVYKPYLKVGTYKGDYRDRADILAAAEKAGHTAVDEGKNQQDVAESSEKNLEECGMMGSMDRPSTPASINMTAATGEELSNMIKDIMSLAGVAKSEPETISTTPSIGLASRDGMDMKSMIDKMNDLETVETIDSMPNDPMPTEPFDAEQHAHHEHPPGADRKGNANNPRAYDTNESAVERLMAEYKKFISEDQDVEESWMHDRTLPPGFYIKLDGEDKPIGPFKDEFALQDTPKGRELAMLRKQGKAEGFYISPDFAQANQK